VTFSVPPGAWSVWHSLQRRKAVALAFRSVGELNIPGIDDGCGARPSAKAAGHGHRKPELTVRRLGTGGSVGSGQILRCFGLDDRLVFASADVLSIDLPPLSSVGKRDAVNTPVLAFALSSGGVRLFDTGARIGLRRRR